MDSKLKIFKEKLAAAGLDAMYVTNGSNVRYLSGYMGADAVLFISQKNNYLITDHRFTEQAERECADFMVIPHLLPSPTVPQLTERFCAEEGVHKLAFERDDLLCGDYESLRAALPESVEMVPCSGIIEDIRYVKSADEIEMLRKACAATDRVFAGICKFLRPGLTEKEVERELLYAIMGEGCDSSFPVIIASGDNGSLPHAIPSDKKLVKGEFVTMDFGCMYKGYHADMTRTVYLGKPDLKAQEIYAMVLEAKNRAQALVKSGVPCKDVDAASRDYFKEKGYGDNFKHGLGHGVGLDIHEAPRLNTTSSQILKSGCLVTIEPGLYFPGWGGIRIEDTVLVTDDGFEDMFTSTCDLVCIDC